MKRSDIYNKRISLDYKDLVCYPLIWVNIRVVLFFYIIPFLIFFLVVRRRKELNSWKSAGLAVRGHNTTQTSMSDGRKWWHDVQWRGVFSAVNNKSRRWQWTMARLILRAYSRRAHSSLSTQQQQEPPPPVYIYHRYCCPRPYPGHSSARKRPISAQQRLSLFSVIPLVSNDNKVYALPPSTPLIHFILLFLSLSLFTMSGATQQVDLFNRRHRK